MKFEAVRIHFLSDVHPEILIPWQRDVTTSPLCRGGKGREGEGQKGTIQRLNKASDHHESIAISTWS